MTEDATIPKRDVDDIERESYIHESKDVGKIVVDNDEDQNTDRTEIGTRLNLNIDTAAVDEPIEWTVGVSDRRIQRSSGQQGRIELEVEGFVEYILSNRNYTNAFTDTRIDTIIRDIVDDVAGDVLSTSTFTIEKTTDVFYQSRNAWDAIVDLANRGDALIYTRGERLYLDPIESLPTKFTLEPTDHTGYELYETDLDLYNNIRVDSGQTEGLEEELTGQSATTTITDSTRETFQVNMRKSEIAQIEIWTAATSSGEVSVRLQADDGGSPVDASSFENDIARRTLNAEFLSDDDYTKFIMPAHTLPDRDPWVIVEANEAGNDIGVDSNGNPVYKAYYPFPLNVRVGDGPSQRKYRKRDKAYTAESLDTFKAAQDFAEGKLNHRAKPRREIQFPARSERAHRLVPGELIEVPYEQDDIEGTYAITGVQMSATAGKGIRLDTEISARDIETL